YIARKSVEELKTLREAGLSRIHVGLESGDDEVLRRVKKGTTAVEQIRAGRALKKAGIELSEYVVLGLGGRERTKEHALATAEVLNAIEPDFVRLRTLVPKINTLLLHQTRKGRFQLLSPHEVLLETRQLLDHLECRTTLTSDHYTNYINLAGRLPEDKERLLTEIDQALALDESRFRPFFVGTQ
ncbi:MAG: radical SAM protein, partial [Deltaproteobacteria bacterium]